MATAARSDLLEREAELAALEASLSEVRAGSGRLVLVAGEAGVGKSALVRSFCAEGAASTRVFTGACDPLFMPRPLGPFVDVARAMGGTLDDLVRRGPNPYSLAESLVEELTRPPPTIVLLEDVHWADEATLDVIRFVAGRVERLAALVVATYRDDELGRDPPPARGARKPGHGSRHSPRQGAAALSWRCRRARRSVRRRCRRALSADFREPVLRHRGAGDAPRPGAGDCSRRRSRPCRATQRRRKAAPRRPVCSPVRRRRRFARGARRSGRRSSERAPSPPEC